MFAKNKVELKNKKILSTGTGSSSGYNRTMLRSWSSSRTRVWERTWSRIDNT